MSDPNRAFVIAIAGPTASGKTTLATALKERYSNSVPVKLFSLDDFYVDNELIEMTGKWKNWDIPSSFALNDLAKAVDHAALEVGPNGVVIIEGLLMFSHPELSRHYRAVVSMELPVDCWKARRFARDEWIQKNEEYFSDVVLPAYQEHGLVPESEHYKLLRVDATSTPDILHPQVFATLEQWRAER